MTEEKDEIQRLIEEHTDEDGVFSIEINVPFEELVKRVEGFLEEYQEDHPEITFEVRD